MREFLFKDYMSNIYFKTCTDINSAGVEMDWGNNYGKKNSSNIGFKKYNSKD